ncbi:MAG: LysR family transcriptional regulator [Pseudomonadota bacterium]|nr:LysR family transcriptional regulator [Pseudomonadota bacterium]
MRDDPKKSPNIRHIRSVLEASKAGTLSLTAERMHVTQPAVSQGIHNVEKRYGMNLFRRGKDGVVPTEAGALLIGRLERAFRHLDAADAALSRRASPLHGHVTAAQLDALMSIVQHGSFVLASRAMGVSRASLHKSLRELERVVGIALFETTSFGVRPTRIAEEFARHVRLYRHELDQAEAEIAALRGGETGRTVVGAMPLARSYLLPKAVSVFTKRHPGHRVAIVEAPFEALLLGLRRGEVDMLIGAMRGDLPARELREEPLFDDELSIVMRSAHPLAGEATLTPEMLAGFPWLMPRIASPLYARFVELFTAAGLPVPSDAVECGSLSAARVLLMESDRLMLLSGAQIVLERAAGLLVSRPHPAGPISRAIGLTYRTDWRPTQAQADLMDTVRDLAAERFAGGGAA